MPPHSAIFYQQMAVDGAGVVYADKEPWKRIGEVANAPIFSHDQIYLTGELVGGHRPRVPDRRLLSPSEYWGERRQVT